METMKRAYQLLKEWKGSDYRFGNGVLDELGEITAKYGKRVLLIANNTYLKPVTERAVKSLRKAQLEIVGGGPVPDAKPNAPREDVYRIESYILHYRPDCIVALGGGSTIDACKASNVLATLGADITPEIDPYFGTGMVSEALKKSGRKLLPMIAVQTSASSGAHLTKYSNITDPVIGQKKLIVDPAIVPTASIFDYETTLSMPLSVSLDGALDAIAHTFEVFCGAKPEYYKLASELAETAIELVVSNTPKLLENPEDIGTREALGLATDLGGYAIMIGGTSGAHLTSFSLVDLVAHGTACGIMNPYYAVYYAPAISSQLKTVGAVFEKYGFAKNIDGLEGRELAIEVANAMVLFGKSVGAPTKLSDLPGFSEEHVHRILTAAKDPQLEMKLQNMPVPMTSDDVDTYMAPIIHAAVTGEMEQILNKEP